jgi:hypothetical protein
LHCNSIAYGKTGFNPRNAESRDGVSDHTSILDYSCQDNRNIFNLSEQKTSLKRRVKLFMDSQGRSVVDILMHNKGENCNVIGTLKPGACFKDVTKECVSDCSDLGPQDAAVFLAGGNDIAKNEAESFLTVLRRKLLEMRHTRVFVFDIPHRHDLPSWSCVNKSVAWANVELRKISKNFSNVTVLELSGLGKRFHTRHGHHLNKLGKRYISGKVLNELYKEVDTVIGEPIPLKN